MVKQDQHHCKGCIHYHYCQAQPEKGCYTSKKEISVEEKIARRKELQKFYKKNLVVSIICCIFVLETKRL